MNCPKINFGSRTMISLSNKSLRIILISVLSSIVCIVSAQNIKDISGLVQSNDNTPMPGVSIKVIGSQIGTVTDVKGNFNLKNVSVGSVLSVTFIGMDEELVKIEQGVNRYIITLKEKVTLLNEVVAIGYGSSKRGDLSGSVSVVKGEKLITAPVHSFDQALAGKVAGVQVSSNEGQPGQGMNIVVRGVGSLTQSNSPLYVIDGFPVEDDLNDAINPNDIESINVLKDASATAIYGARGSNGVIIIETKKGKSGQADLTFSASYGFQEVLKTMDMMNPYEFVKYQLEKNTAYATAEYLKPEEGITLDSYKTKRAIDWQDETFKRAPVQTYDIAFRGGTKNMRYSLSGSYFNQEGIIVNSGYEKYQGRIYFEQDFSPKLRIGATASYSSATSFGQEASSYGTTGSSSSYLMYSIWGYRPVAGLNSSEDFLLGELFDPEQDYSGQNYIINPVFSAKNEYRSKIFNTLLLNSFFTYKFTPNFYLRSTFNYASYVTTNETFNNSSSRLGNPRFPSNIRGVNASWVNSATNHFSNENTLHYSKTFNRIHRLEATAGATFSKRSVGRYGFASQQIPNEQLGMSGIDEGIPYESYASESGWGLISYLGRLNYILRGKYIFTGTMRADGSSKFAPDKRWGYFPSGAFAWRMSEESFLKQNKNLSNAKLRLSYGETGNNRVGDFAYLSQMAVTSAVSYSFQNGSPSKGIVPISIANKDLTWETAAQFNVGYDLGLFKNRVELVLDYYNRTTRDLQMYANTPYYSGFANAYRNIGKLMNNGLEISLNTVNIDNKKFTWTTNFNISFNRNKVLGLADDEDYLLSDVAWGVNFNTTPLYIAQIGQPAAQFYGYKWEGNYQFADFDEVSQGVYVLKDNVTTNGMARDKIQPGDIKYKDQNGDKIVDSNDLTVLGDAYPKHTGGLTNDFRYKNISLNVFFQWSYGNKIMNANRILFEGNALGAQNFNQFASYVNRWTPENQNNVYYRNGGQGPVGVYSDRTLEDGSYLRLKSVSLTYETPKKLIQLVSLKGLSFSLSAQNLFTLTKYTGMDPEVSVRNSALTPGFDYSAYPRARNLILGVKAIF